jgi:hypothetical protein
MAEAGTEHFRNAQGFAHAGSGPFRQTGNLPLPAFSRTIYDPIQTKVECRDRNQPLEPAARMAQVNRLEGATLP